MDSHPEVADFDSCSHATELVQPLLEAFSGGTAFIGVYDEDDFLRYANSAFREAFGVVLGTTVTFSSIILDAVKGGTTLRIESNDPIAFIADAQTRRRGQVNVPRQRLFPVDFINEKWFWCTETLLPSGWIVLTGADITSLKRFEKVLSNERDQALILSGLDELTGIPNRRFSLARLDALLQTQTADSPAVCVALIDLDHFKSINDTFGHETGDIALRHFAQHCAAVLPKGTLVGRMGGEEFLVAFAGSACSHLTFTLQQLLTSIPSVSSRLPAHVNIELSFSAGVAEAIVGESRVDLLARADNALYEAKRLGRSRVEVHLHPAIKTR